MENKGDANMPPVIQTEGCIGCRLCYDTCPLDVFGFDPDRNVAIVLYPLECWHCGVCELECPEGVIDVQLPAEVLELENGRSSPKTMD